MDSWAGIATLEWWANRSTCLGTFGARATIRVTAADWMSAAVLDPPLSDDDREVFGLLMDLDPVFTLRFEEGSTLLVNVVDGHEEGLALTAYEAEAGQRVGSRQVWQ
ncbi:hypothetical protein [Streptacidiphilus sp. MAP12-20]|uniref:hypothetical protein n=1 Tax=Streptacidiphilus sp. MAP12-20 TaxID=3156299 RepID=UPI0035161F37